MTCLKGIFVAVGATVLAACASAPTQEVRLKVVEATPCPPILGRPADVRNCDVVVEDESGQRRSLSVLTRAQPGDELVLSCREAGAELDCTSRNYAGQ